MVTLTSQSVWERQERAKVEGPWRLLDHSLCGRGNNVPGWRDHGDSWIKVCVGDLRTGQGGRTMVTLRSQFVWERQQHARVEGPW
ncbi:hypothetical protein ElyMa_002061000 [Elysia marginata]|uniref:Uncharacterized protein n=1 Tax=Elysia marginata TaxID=1093978 RepID=A0AAV4FBB3_9GAST|nr:hypothetical protein ElyMa_002061000 [Elysia marginata]